jgi:hypothetical protein
MRSLAMMGAASALVLLNAAEGAADTLCVDPDDGACFATIQAAVAAAVSGDIVSIRAKADESAYNEAVTITTENLTITGEDAAPTFRSIAEMIEFSRLSTVDLDDPDVGLWLDNYPDAQDFLDALATLEDFIQEETLIEQCPAVVVEVCDTPETGPGVCGKDSGVPVFRVEASGTSFADLTIRHGSVGIDLALDVTDTTVERVCFRGNDIALLSEPDFDPSTDEPIFTNDRTDIRQSFVDGRAVIGGLVVAGDDAVVERNLLLNAEGMVLGGDRYQVSRNAIAVPTDFECISVEGADGLVSANVRLSCDGALVLFNAVDTTVIGNLFQGTSGGDDGIQGFGVPGFVDDGPGNLRTIVRNNIVRLTSDDGIELEASEALIEGNLIERTAGSDVDEAGLNVAGNDNQILHNLIRFSSRSAITLNGFFVFSEEEGDVFTPSTGNLMQGNLLTRNHTAGIHLPAGEDFGAGPVPRVADTTIDDNIITLNDGEGIAIPEGVEDPANEPAASDTTITNNTFRNNRTDICDESDSTVIGAGNGSPTVSDECVVGPGVELDF